MKSRSKQEEQITDVLAQANNNLNGVDQIEEKHRKIEEALDQERQLYMDLANSQPTGIYRLRAFSSTSLDEKKWRSSDESPFVFEFFNDRFCEILKVDRTVFENNPGIINDFILEIDKAEFAKKNVEANQKLIPFIWEGRLLIDGEMIWGHFESIPRKLPDGDVIWTGVFFDISKRKKKEQEIQAKNDELQLVNAEKDKFFSIIAHDLKSPFNAIVGFSKLLVEEIKENNTEGIQKYAEIVLESSHIALDLLTNLMDWSRSQTGRMKYNPKIIDLQDIINETVLIFSQIAKAKSISVSTEIVSKLPVCADKSMICTVLRNLISNAIKYTNPGGKICISAEKKHGHYRIKVSDTGVGISKSCLNKLFRIDEKCTTPGTQDELGTGLGLILCKDFVERHGGQIWVESEENIGSNFIFTLNNKVS